MSPKEKSKGIQLRCGNVPFTLMASDEEERDAWLKDLQDFINACMYVFVYVCMDGLMDLRSRSICLCIHTYTYIYL